MSTINVDIVSPETGTKVTVNQVEISQPIVGTGTAPFRNTIIGTGAGASLTTGPTTTSGTLNVVLGTDAFRLSTIGRQNTIIGEKAFELTTSGDFNTVVGNLALGSAITTGGNSKSGQTAIGAGALGNYTTGIAPDPTVPIYITSNNTAIGTSAGGILTTGADNTFVGAGSSANISSGMGNVVVGKSSGTVLNAIGDYNTFLGNETGYNFNGGNNNTYLGAKPWAFLLAPVAETGNNNVLVGYNVFKATPSASNSITLGNSSNTVLRCAVTSITSLSDARDKEDIKDLSTGLDFVKSLRPVEFTWKDRNEDGKQGIADFGFIAQDLKKSQEDAKKAEVLKLVYEENPEKLEASYGKLIPILVKAIQELSAEVKQLKNK
jgi:hypothetical protein